jgi:hypothetical protein
MTLLRDSDAPPPSKSGALMLASCQLVVLVAPDAPGARTRLMRLIASSRRVLPPAAPNNKVKCGTSAAATFDRPISNSMGKTSTQQPDDRHLLKLEVINIINPNTTVKWRQLTSTASLLAGAHKSRAVVQIVLISVHSRSCCSQSVCCGRPSTKASSCRRPARASVMRGSLRAGLLRSTRNSCLGASCRVPTLRHGRPVTPSAQSAPPATRSSSPRRPTHQPPAQAASCVGVWLLAAGHPSATRQTAAKAARSTAQAPASHSQSPHRSAARGLRPPPAAWGFWDNKGATYGTTVFGFCWF